MGKAFNLTALWSQWGLLRRIATLQSLLLLGGAALVTVLLIQAHRGSLIQDQQARARLLTLVLTPLVAEQAAVGDDVAIMQLLQRQATVYDDTSRLAWIKDGGDEVAAAPSPDSGSSPRWFRDLVDIPALRHGAPVDLGGIHYGELRVTLEPGPLEAKLWKDSIGYLLSSLGAAVVILLAPLLVLRRNLGVLRNLADAADRFSRGDHTVSIKPEGARELTQAEMAFNNMTGRIRTLLDELAEKRHRVREQLHFNEELIECLPVPMYYKTPEGAYISVNKAWEAFFGVSRAEMIGRTVRTLYEHMPEVASLHERTDQELLRIGGVQTYEIPVRTRDGRERQAMYAKTLLTNSDGQTAGMIGVITDLTELKQAQEQAQQALVGKTAAEEASHAKSMFLANMSHEIRTPLTAIIGFSEALLDVNQSMAERIDGIRTINRAGRHLLDIINEILDLSKIEAGRLEVERLAVPLFPLVDEVVSMALIQAESRGIGFEVEHVFPLPEVVQSDPVRIKQILLNIIGNAIKFTEEGRVKLNVGYDADAAKLVLEVSDTGIGISPEQLPRLFQPFSQADASTTRRFGGTGLGLVLSKQLAELLGGSITVDSTPGVGTRFTITVDAGPAQAMVHTPEEARRLRGRLAEAEEVFSLAGTVLLAEDNPDNQRLVALNARRLGVDIELVENGQLAVDAALARPYDLIFMDMQMPVMDGLTAVRILRERGYEGTIVALTANATRRDMDNCLAAGCNGFMTKPIERQKFTDTLARHLGRGVQPRDAELDDAEIDRVILQRTPCLAEVYNHFRHRISHIHDALRQALATGDSETIRSQARELRSMGADYTHPQIVDLGGQLEFAATSGNGRAVRDLVKKIGCMAERMPVARPGEVSASADTSSPKPPPDDEMPLVSLLLEAEPEMADLVDYFLTRLPGYEQDLKAAVSGGDPVALQKKAHDLKSVGGGYGYPQVTELAAELEVRAGEGDLKRAGALVDQFSHLARRIEAGARTARAAAAVG